MVHQLLPCSPNPQQRQTNKAGDDAAPGRLVLPLVAVEPTETVQAVGLVDDQRVVLAGRTVHEGSRAAEEVVETGAPQLTGELCLEHSARRGIFAHVANVQPLLQHGRHQVNRHYRLAGPWAAPHQQHGAFTGLQLSRELQGSLIDDLLLLDQDEFAVTEHHLLEYLSKLPRGFGPSIADPLDRLAAIALLETAGQEAD